MPKYLFQASYTTAGLEGLRKDGGTGRVAAVEKLAAGMGGRVESFYFAFGEADAYVVVDLPDQAAAGAVSLAVNQSGLVTLKTTVLLTPEEVDEAVHRTVDYVPPGG